MQEFEKILSRALTDAKFREHLKTDPEGALKAADIEPTPEKVAALKAAGSSLRHAHQAFGGMARPD
jgi:hypothetical protein